MEGGYKGDRDRLDGWCEGGLGQQRNERKRKKMFIQVKGIAHLNFFFLTSHDRKTLQTKNMYNEVSHIVCFSTFSVKRKENYLHRKQKIYVFRGP